MSELSSWLDSIGLVRYASVLEDNGVDLESLPLLSESDLERLGILLGHRKKLLKAVADLDAVPLAAAPNQSKLTTSTALDADGERRIATVLFSDLSGYTAMNEKLDPEMVANIIGHIKAESVKIVESHGGMVNQFVGDEVLALFGIPVAHEDDPVRAIRAALALHRMVREMAPSVEPRIGQTLRLHTGIDTGLVVTNLRDRRDGTVGITGDAVNTGARLAAWSPADEVWISPQTYHRVADYFEMQAMSPIALKGKAEPLAPYRVIAPTKTETRFEAAQRRGLTGYIGRTQELATLFDCQERTQAGDGQFVAVVGEAGAGKSRLLFELRNGLPRNRIPVLQGRCQSYGVDTPYLPFLDALRRALELREDDRHEQLLEKAVANVRAINPALERFLPYYLHLLSIPSEQHAMPATLQGAERKRALEEALCAIFTLAAKRQPLVIILEDWHWADATSDAVLKHLVGLIADYALMVVLLCRPEYDLNWAAPSQITRIVLKPLSIVDTGAMASTALKIDAMPEELRTLIHERTAGNPLFIEEVCHTLVEESIVSIVAGKATLTRSINTVQLPETVQAVIRSRVDRLDKEAQDVLQLAAVIGREFARTLLERVAAASDNLAQTLETLRSQDLIRQVRVVPEPEYIFKHVLTQVVVYETLLLMRRQTLHQMVGEAIEEIYLDRLEEHYESLAYHYQRSDNKEKAIKYLELAGDKAKSKWVLQQTVSSYQQAIQLLAAMENTPQRMQNYIDIAVKWADLIVPSSEVISALKTAAGYAEELADLDRFANAVSFIGQLLFYMGDLESAAANLQRVIGIADRLSSKDRVGSSYRCLGQLYLFGYSRGVDALACLDQAIPIVQATENRFEESCCFGLIGLEYGFQGKFDQSFDAFDNAIRIARRGQQHSIECWDLYWRAQVHLLKGEWQTAVATAAEAIELALRIENMWAVTWSTLIKSFGQYVINDDAALVQQAKQAVESLGINICISIAWCYLGEMVYLSGNAGEALDMANRALAGLHYGTYYSAEVRAYRLRSMAESQRADPDRRSVTSDMEKALSLGRAQHRMPDLAISHFRYAQLLHKSGACSEAGLNLNEADRLFQDLGMSWWLDEARNFRRRL